MKRITLKGYLTPDKSSIYNSDRAYSYSFFQGQTAYMSSRYEMERFMTEANKALNDYILPIPRKSTCRLIVMNKNTLRLVSGEKRKRL